MPKTCPLTSEEIDDGWCLEEAHPTSEYEAYELVAEESTPSSGFEEAFWEQYEGRKLIRHFGGGVSLFGAKRSN